MDNNMRVGGYQSVGKNFKKLKFDSNIKIVIDFYNNISDISIREEKWMNHRKIQII